MNADTLRNLLYKLLPYYLLMIFIVTAVGSLLNYKIHDEWKMGDWLINYAGGFVRRGFTGEIFALLSNTFSINPSIFVIITQLSCYALFFYFAYRLLKNVDILKYWILIISPFIFTFQITEFEGGYRKEIIYFAILSFLAYAKTTYQKEKFERLFLVFLALYSLLILSHEMLAVFVPYLLILYLINNPLSSKKVTTLAVLALPLLASMLLSIYYKGSAEHNALILQTLSNLGYPVSQGGAIAALSYPATHGLTRVLEEINKYYFAYLSVAALSLLAFIPVWPSLRAVLKHKLSLIAILASIFGTFVIAMFALDWGRLLYIHLVSLFIVSLASEKISIMSASNNTANETPAPNKLIILLVLIWAMTFSIPTCCISESVIAQQFSQMNYINLAYWVLGKL